MNLAACFDFVVATEASVVCARNLSSVVDVALTTKTLRETKEYAPYDVVSLLNVLDRTEDPHRLLIDAIDLLRKKEQTHEEGGALLLGFSQPLKPFVQPQTFATPPSPSPPYFPPTFTRLVGLCRDTAAAAGAAGARGRAGQAPL